LKYIILSIMKTLIIESPDDPRLEPFRHMTDKELMHGQGLFVAEGEHLVRRLLSSGMEVHAILGEEDILARLAPDFRKTIPAYGGAKELIRKIPGFDFHRGVMALGVRPAPRSLESIITKNDGRLALVICPEINDAENLGAIFRTAAAFAVDGVILGPRCIDPYYRRTIRVSMGSVFTLPLVCSGNLQADLNILRERFQVTLIATVLHDATHPLPDYGAPERFGLLFGTESQGLSAEWLAQCDVRLTLPMPAETDSLNVAVAAGIFLYHCARQHVPTQ
jgi:tRNA G18 (ribose-2'-O)-methylase SpoU